MICRIFISDAGIDDGLERRTIVSKADSMATDPSGALIVKSSGSTKGTILAPGTWVKATLEIEAS